ncbi:MAG: hypothetical protein KW804_03595, partial [Candidatus Doudnabacteria bacterium]|nr:hypothetical protein [Candidatus Doudnabacteria bacterium]
MTRLLIIFLLISSTLNAQTYSKGYFKHGDSLFLGSGLGDSIFLPSATQTKVIVKDSSKYQTTLSVGTSVTTSPLTVTNFTTSFPSPQTGTIGHFVSDNSVNGRLSFDTYNDASFTGSNYQGRRARGTAASPTPPIADDVLVAIGADGYGTSSFTNASVGSMNIRSEGTFTNTSKPTYVSFTTTPSGSTTQAERMRIKSTGVVQITGLGAGVPVTDASGNLSVITGTASQVLRRNAGNTAYEFATIGGTGTVTDVSVTTANGVSGSVATSTSTPAISITLGSITPTSVAASGTVTGSNLSGTNTGDQTTVSGNAGTATTFQTPRLINGKSFNGSADIFVDNDLLAYEALGSPVLAETVQQKLAFSNTSTSLVDGQIKFTAVYLPKAATLTGIKVYVRVLGSYTGDNNNRIGLYSYSGGVLTLVASSANNSSLWTSAANAIQTIPFSGTYAASAG